MLIVFSEISVGETEDDYNVGKYDKLLSTFIPSSGNSNTISEFKMFSIGNRGRSAEVLTYGVFILTAIFKILLSRRLYMMFVYKVTTKS